MAFKHESAKRQRVNSVNQRVSVYQPDQQGLKFPAVPLFATLAEERLHRKKHLVAACRAFALHGFDYGFAGHLTVRDPEFPQLYWTNPMAVHFSQVGLSNLILVNHEGQVVEGSYAVNRAGYVLHAAVHETHPDIVAMCHAHTIYGTAFAATGRPLAAISQDAACFFEDHVVIKEEAGAVAVETEAGYSVAAAFKNVVLPGLEWVAPSCSGYPRGDKHEFASSVYSRASGGKGARGERHRVVRGAAGVARPLVHPRSPTGSGRRSSGRLDGGGRWSEVELSGVRPTCSRV